MIYASIEGAILFFVAFSRLLAERGAGSFDPRLVVAQAAIWTVCGLAAFHFTDLYDQRRVRRFVQFLSRLPKAVAVMLLLIGLVQLLVPVVSVSWTPLLEMVLLSVACLLPIRAVFHHLLVSHPFSRRVLVLGTTELAGKLVREMVSEPDLRDVVIGVADDGTGAFRPTFPSLRLGSIDNLSTIIDGFEPELIVCALAERHDPVLMRELLKPRARGIPVEDGVVAYERLTGKIAIEYVTPRAILFSRRAGSLWLALAMARALSLLTAVLGLILFAPFFIPIALLIKLDSPGPIFFLHKRVGLGGRPFNLFKFRTMTTEGALSEWAADNGHRTTRVGYWLRRFRIDEVPQFFNILRGDMNLVGPRPHPLSNLDLFTEHIPYYGVRCSVRPGVTGWAQIRYGYANNLSEETEKMRYDLHYIKHLSLGLDLRILFETARVVIEGGRSATLVDEDRAHPLPIYFGLAPHDAPSTPIRLSSASLPTTEGVVVSMEERRAKTSSRGVR